MTTTPTQDHADRETPCPVCLGDGYIFEDEPCPVCHGLGFVRRGDMETEAEIRTRIADEIKQGIKSLGPDLDPWDGGYRAGMRAALRIIERGTGVAGEEER